MRRRSQFGLFEGVILVFTAPTWITCGIAVYCRGFRVWRDDAGGTAVVALCMVGPPVLAWVIGRATAKHDWQPGDPRECRRCGYDLTGVRSGRCPECGHNRHSDVMRWR